MDGPLPRQGANFQNPNARPQSAQSIIFLVFLYGIWLLKWESTWNPAGSPHLHGYLVQATLRSCWSIMGASWLVPLPPPCSHGLVTAAGVFSYLGRGWEGLALAKD